MNKQVNLRFSGNILASAQMYAEEHGFSTVQEFIKETVREKLFDEPEISKEELALVRKLATVSEAQNLYGTEKELLKKLKRK